MVKLKAKSNYMAMPSSPKTTRQRSPLPAVLKKGHDDDTAPNTPEDGGGAEDFVYGGYDPDTAFAALAPTNSGQPPSPLRGGMNDHNNKDVGFREPPKTYGATSERRGSRSTGEEEKKESEDVVAKTLSYFDHVCAVPKTSKARFPIGGAKSGVGSQTRCPEWGLSPSEAIHDEDETTTIPSHLGSYENSSANLTSYQSTIATSTGPSPSRKEWANRSPSLNHENFEVVLDPSSLPDEENEELVPKRRWRFSKRNLKDKNHEDVESTDDVRSSRSPTRDLDMGKDLRRNTVDNLMDTADDHSLEQLEKHMQQQLKSQGRNQTNAAEDYHTHKSTEEDGVEDEYCDDDGQDEASLDNDLDREEINPKTKSIMKRFIRKCRKLPLKLVAKSSDRYSEDSSNRNEHDGEEQVYDPISQMDQNVSEEELLQGSAHIACIPIEEGNEEASEDTEMKDHTESQQLDAAAMTTSASAAFNSLFATITKTFDETEEVPVNESAASEATSAGVANTIREETQNESFESMVESLDHGEEAVDTVDQSNDEPPRNWGWKRVKQIRKSAKNLVTAKKAGSSKKDNTDIATKTDASTEQALSKPDSTESATQEIQKPKAIWKTATDPNTGRTYYYHRKTRETTWIKPDEYEQYERDLKSWKALVETVKASADAEQAIPQDMDSGASSPKILPDIDSGSVAESQKEDTKTPQDSQSKQEKEGAESSETLKLESSSARNLPSRKEASDKAKASKHSPSKVVENDFDPEKKKEVEKLLKRLPPQIPPQNASLEQLMTEYKGREDDLLEDLRAKVESRPFDEPDEEDYRGASRNSKSRSSRSTPPRSPYRATTRTTTMMSRASVNTRSSALTDRTEKIKNTGKGRFNAGTINETFSTTTSLSSRVTEDPVRFVRDTSPDRIPSRVPVPRERQLMVEELTDSRISAEICYEGNGQSRGRIMRGKLREHVAKYDEATYDGDNDTDLDDGTAAYDTDTYGTDSVSALSETDTDFLHRKDNFDQARRRALDDAIEGEDWDLAAAISEGMRAANMPGGYEKAHTSWNQSELDKFIANNDWHAVKSYIARMREASKKSQRSQEDVIQAPRSATRTSSSTSKNIGARSQLQHKDLMSESSWTSDSQSSYESYDSESEI
eukprot:CAMPEP_0113489490 /NCGR_PEP_ID=MMETSP0014_2-20120614/26556_1 /TAXON_ID=2857 /ORGANISM="Nitzschia sp." /LENGTH=1133 /DNA_ID=CAMNT_0000383229 /DNA_START=141 /DNA_END=3542 /DNA_ORIENTATION=- /assembly_acc=CAM_ASM_000159